MEISKGHARTQLSSSHRNMMITAKGIPPRFEMSFDRAWLREVIYRNLEPSKSWPTTHQRLHVTNITLYAYMISSLVQVRSQTPFSVA